MANISAIKLPDGITYDIVDKVSKDIFIAEKDMTTYDEISAAIAAGKVVFAKDTSGANPIFYQYIMLTSSGNHYFIRFRANNTRPDVYGLYVGSSDVWTADTFVMPIVDAGHLVGSQVSANSYLDRAVTFNKTFPSAPNVTASLFSTGTAGNIGQISVAVKEISTTGCTLRVFNGSTAARTPAIEWIAVET